MSRTGASRAVDRSRLRLLLASGSVAALLIAGGAPPTRALGKITPQSSCTVIQNGGTVGSLSNSSPTGSCILVENNANVTGNVTNASAGILIANGPGEGGEKLNLASPHLKSRRIVLERNKFVCE